MRIRDAGRVCDRLWYLGREESGIYLLEGGRGSLVVSGGMSYLAPTVLDQMHAFGIDEKRIIGILILHAHFDHIGLVPLLKRRNPASEVFASARGWEILRMPNAIETVNTFSRLVAERLGVSDALAGEDLEWREDIKGSTVREGDGIDLGGIRVEILETPGHSSCSISAYVPELRALFPSDAGGIPFAEMIVPAGNSNYTQYQRSLEKLNALDVGILCADHYGYIAGGEAEGYLRKSIDAAAEKRTWIEETYRTTGSIDGTVERLVAEVYRRQPDYFLPPEIYAGVYRQTVRHIAAELEKGSGSARPSSLPA